MVSGVVGAGHQDELNAGPRDAAIQAVLIGYVGDHMVALPAAAIERIMRMVALTAVPGAPASVAGVVNLQGEVLPVVDPRPALGVPTPPVDPAQRLVVLRARTRYILWLDSAERVVTVSAADLTAIDAGGTLAPLVLRLERELVPVLSVVALDPGPVLPQQSRQPE